MNDETGWSLLRIKRTWIPEWLWRALGQLPVKEPWRRITTRQITADEALHSWSEEDR